MVQVGSSKGRANTLRVVSKEQEQHFGSDVDGELLASDCRRGVEGSSRDMDVLHKRADEKMEGSRKRSVKEERGKSAKIVTGFEKGFRGGDFVCVKVGEREAFVVK